MDTLTKENFWDEMEQKYPKAMEHFLNWIDNYKNNVKWNYFFGAGHKDAHNYHGAPKYHELPIAMQFGIFIEYTYHCVEEFKLIAKGVRMNGKLNFADAIKEGITGSFAYLEETL